MDIAKLTPRELEELVPDADLDAFAASVGTALPSNAELDALPDCEATEKLKAIYAGMRSDLRRLIVFGVVVGFAKPLPLGAQEILDQTRFLVERLKEEK